MWISTPITVNHCQSIKQEHGETSQSYYGSPRERLERWEDGQARQGGSQNSDILAQASQPAVKNLIPQISHLIISYHAQRQFPRVF